MKRDDPIKQWATTHPAAAVNRVVGRLERFANNTSNEETSLAGTELVRILKEAQPDAPQAEESSSSD